MSESKDADMDQAGFSKGADPDGTTLQRAIQAHRAGRVEDAEQLYKLVLGSVPDHFEALNLLAMLKAQTKQFDEAERYLFKALKVRPDNFSSLMNLGSVMQKQGKVSEAEHYYSKAIQLRPDYAEGYRIKADLLKNTGKLDAAIRCYRHAVELKPGSAELIFSLGKAYKLMGDIDSAVACFRKALQIRPGYSAILNNLATCKKFTSTDDADFAAVIQALSQVEADSQDALYLNFALGKMFDDCGQYDHAFTHFKRANEIKRKTAAFNRAELVDFVDRNIDVFSKDFFANWKCRGSFDELPVFIIGMPRSGTSLIEQVLASHPRVQGKGELKNIYQIARRLSEAHNESGGYPECIPSASCGEILLQAERYVEEVRAGTANGTLRTTDKMPFNFKYLGLIALLFPRCRIIECRRNALDTCLSNYFEAYLEGNEFSYDLNDLGFYYRQYERLMSHWKKVLNIEILDLPYEEFIDDPERYSKRLIAFCGLDWTDKCLEYYKTKRSVLTASAWQVRQPVYKTSRQRWRNYEKHLGPLKESLGWSD